MSASLATARLQLRPLTLDDAPFVLELLNDPTFVRFVGDKQVRTLDQACAYLTAGPLASYRRHGFGLGRVALRADDRPIGICGLLQRDDFNAIEIGFGYLERFAGQGYAHEAAAAVLADARTRLGLARITAITLPDNAASGRVLEKLGLRCERLITPPGMDGPRKLFV